MNLSFQLFKDGSLGYSPQGYLPIPASGEQNWNSEAPGNPCQVTQGLP